MNVRAKFKVQSILARGNGYGEVELVPVCGGSEENLNFWKYTPGGQMKMSIDNQAALDAFKPGQEYYVDFTPCPPKA